MERGGSGGEREDVLGLEVLGRAALELGCRGPVVSQPERRVAATAAISSSPIAGGWKPSVSSRRLSDTFGCIGDREAYGLGRRGRPRQRLVPRVADGQDRTGPVGTAAEGPKRWPGRR